MVLHLHFNNDDLYFDLNTSHLVFMYRFPLCFAIISLDSTNHHIVNYTKVGTKATKYKMQIKSGLDSAAADSSCRGPHQVLACSVIGVFIQLTHVVYCGEEQSLGGYFLFLYCR